MTCCRAREYVATYCTRLLRRGSIQTLENSATDAVEEDGNVQQVIRIDEESLQCSKWLDVEGPSVGLRPQ